MIDLDALVEDTVQKTDDSRKTEEKGKDIAVTGISFMFPGACTLDELDRMLSEKRDMVSYPNEERKKLIRTLFEEKDLEFLPGAYLKDIDKMDYGFFKLTKKEAELMDPAHRLFLQCAWHAFEDAGYTREELRKSNTGVFVGSPQCGSYYQCIKRHSQEDALTGKSDNLPAFIASRAAYTFDLKGPALMVDTVCSSSLTALNQAVEAIHLGNCNAALVGGVNILLDAVTKEGAPIPPIQSSTGRAMAFSEEADGTGIGEAVAAIVIKPYWEAVKDHSQIYGIIKACAVNNDGKSIGITAPNGEAQEELIKTAWNQAGVLPEQINYIECHGTGTNLGDPIELSALKKAFESYTDKKQFCGIGSFKSNIGHADSAAGLAGFIKCIASHYYRKWYPTNHFLFPNQKFSYFESPFYVADRVEKWKDGEEAISAVSSFGLSGTNCHVIFQDAPKREKEQVSEKQWAVFPLSAHTESVLTKNAEAYLSYLKEHKKISILDFSYTAKIHRTHMEKRICILFQTQEQLIRKLNKLLQNKLAGDTQEKIFSFKDAKYLQESNKSTESEAEKEAIDYVAGNRNGWKDRKEGYVIHLPEYQFDKKAVWLSYDRKEGVQLENTQEHQEIYQEVSQKQRNTKGIEKQLLNMITDIFDYEEPFTETDMEFVGMGFDSISVMQLKNAIREQYNLDLSPGLLLGEYNTVSLLSEYIAGQTTETVDDSEDSKEVQKNIKSVKAETMAKNEKTIANKVMAPSDTVSSIISQQLSLMEKQLQLLNGQDMELAAVVEEVRMPRIPEKKTEDKSKKNVIHAVHRTGTSQMTEAQMRLLEKMVKEAGVKFRKAKECMQQKRKDWSNGRFVKGFVREWKDLQIPVMAKKAQGAYIWDIDENKYLDFSMGFGVQLFGYNKPELAEVLSDAVKESMILGPVTDDAFDVARLIKQATGVERVAFSNSGTEAIMNLVRIARAATGKDQIAAFQGSFHGTFDGVYALSQGNKTYPLSLGTPDNMVKDLTLLPYGEEESISYIKENIHNLAAVLVEPVQSRNPDLQPVQFLKRIRQITEENNVILIFDEVINGFRLALGGAQEYYGIRADLVSYGKVIGGGLPIGIFAGKAKFMDLVDGGTWNYNDESEPKKTMVQTGGTFCHHPVTMRLMKKVLNILLEDGGNIQKELNYKTRVMADYMNHFFDEHEIPVHVAVGGSQFIFKSKDDTLVRFLYYSLILKGIYIWEGGTCYLSVAHTDEDIIHFIQSTMEICISISQSEAFSFKNMGKYEIPVEELEQLRDKLVYVREDLRAFSEKDRKRIEKKADIQKADYILPMVPSQVQALTLNIMGRKNREDISDTKCSLNGALDVERMRQVFDEIVMRHPVLRTDFIWRKLSSPVQIAYRNVKSDNRYYDLSEKTEGKEEEIENYVEAVREEGFSDKKSKICFLLIREEKEKYQLRIVYETSLFDGWSLNNLLLDILRQYKNGLDDGKVNYAFAECIRNYNGQDNSQAEVFWKKMLGDYTQKVDSGMQKTSGTGKFQEGILHLSMEKEVTEKLEDAARKSKVTMFAAVQAAWALTCAKEEQTDKVLIGFALSGRQRSIEGIEDAVGLFSNIMPMLVDVNTGDEKELARQIYKRTFDISQFEFLSVYDIAGYASMSSEALKNILYTKSLIYLNYPSGMLDTKELKVMLEQDNSYVNVPFRIYAEQSDTLKFILRYDKSVYPDEKAEQIKKELSENVLQVLDRM